MNGRFEMMTSKCGLHLKIVIIISCFSLVPFALATNRNVFSNADGFADNATDGNTTNDDAEDDTSVKTVREEQQD